MKSSNENSHPSSTDRTLVVMAKAPRPGMVKTRLAQQIPAETVTELYRCFFADTMALARSMSDVKIAIVCPASDLQELEHLAPQGVDVVAQKGEGLAAGLTFVFAHFAGPGREHVVAFNCDSPHLPASVLDSAFEALNAHDLVLGPTHDGGYYLVGAKAHHPHIFEGDGIGTGSALEALLARARRLELSVGFTDPFYDIDVEEDLIRLAAELRLYPARAPRTAAWLQEWAGAEKHLRASAAEL